MLTEPLVQTGSWQHIENFHQDDARDKTPHVSPPGYASHSTRGKASREDLDQKPIPEKEKGWKLENLEKEKDGDERQDPGPRIEQQIPAHDPCDGSTRSNGWNLGIPVGKEMDQTGRYTAEEIKEKISDVPQPVLHVVSEDVKEPHVSEEVKDPPMEKHGSQEGEQLLEGRKMGRDGRIRVAKRDNPKQEKGLHQMGFLGKLP